MRSPSLDQRSSSRPARATAGRQRTLWRASGAVEAVAAVGLAALVASCAHKADERSAAAGWVAPGDERLSLVAAARPDQRRAVRFTDAWQIEEYGRSSSGSLEVEYLFLAADPDGSVVLDANFDVSRAVRLFRRNREGTSDWGVLGRVGKLGGTLFYRPYRLGDRACFGFKGDLRLRADDPRRRPGEVLLGYGCSVAGGTLSPATIEAFLDGVGPRRPIAPVHLPSSPWGAGALEFARGSAEASGGLVSFPLRLAELYTTTDSGDAW